MGIVQSNEPTIRDRVNSILNFINRDIDNEYFELMASAIQYGMKPNEFWESTIVEVDAYQRAYINNSHYQAHLQGLYVNRAFEIVLGNAFAKKGAKPLYYPSTDEFNPLKVQKKVEENSKEKQEDKTKKLFSLKKKFLERKGTKT